MVKRLTRRSAKPILAGSNPAPGSHRELAQWSARKPYTLTVSGSSPEFPTSQDFLYIFAPENQVSRIWRISYTYVVVSIAVSDAVLPLPYLDQYADLYSIDLVAATTNVPTWDSSVALQVSRRNPKH